MPNHPRPKFARLLAFGALLILPSLARSAPASVLLEAAGKAYYRYPQGGAACLRVFDRDGRRVFDRAGGDIQERMDLSTLRSGAYLVWIQDVHGKSTFTRIEKQ